MSHLIKPVRALGRLTRISLTLLGGLAVCLPAQADLANGWGPSPIEILRLPPYCQDFFLKKALPANCDGVHHLCAGRVLMNRVMDVSIPRAERKRIAHHARNEVEYIFGRPNNAECTYLNEARAAQQQLSILEIMVR